MKKYLDMLLKTIDLNKLLSGFATGGGKKPLGVIVSAVDINKITSFLLDDVINDALDKVVTDTSNPFDNTAKQMLYPPLCKHLKIVIAERVDKMRAESGEVVPEVEEKKAA